MGNFFRGILNNNIGYNLVQTIFGSKQAREKLVQNYICPKPNDRILDIGCGTGDLLNYLPTSCTYYGFDMNPNYIQHAQKKFGLRGNFQCENINTIKLDQNTKPFKLILAMGIIHHLNDTEAKKLIEIAKSLLAENGKLITLDCCYTNNQNKLARYIINKDRGEHIRQDYSYEKLTKPYFNHVKTSIRNDLLRIPYTHIIMECNNYI